MPPEFELNIEEGEITPCRKLKTVWTYEAAQDIRDWNSIAADQLAKDLAEEIKNEIDEEILRDLKNLADSYRKEQEEELRFKNRKKKILPRSIDEDWEVSRFD